MNEVQRGNQNKAKEFIGKFGFGVINIDSFDMFIIDKHMATDPETSDKTSIAYKGFTQQRNTAKGQLNKAAGYLSDQAFQISVKTPGIEYVVTPWTINAKEVGQQVGARIRDYTHNRISSLIKLQLKAKELGIFHDSPEFHQCALNLSFMEQQGIILDSKVAGLVKQYNTAADAVEKQVKTLIESTSKMAITDQSKE